MSRPLRWDVEGRVWPHRDHSRFVETDGLRWHVQHMGEGPAILLLHGTGASGHSWRDVMPLLADKFTVFAPDLPGHAFTSGRLRSGLSLGAVTGAVGDLCDAMAIRPQLVIGHSAGAAIALQLARGGWRVPMVGLNPAIVPFGGVARHVYPAMAKLLLLNPFAPRIFAARARLPGETARFLDRATGSKIDAEGLRCYETLFGNSRHCSGALEMMASWNLDALERDFARIANQILFIHSSGDPAVHTESVEQAAARLANARTHIMKGLGHLAHEEAPAEIVSLIADFLRL